MDLPLQPIDRSGIEETIENFRWDQVEANFELISKEFARLNERLDALSAEVEKLRDERQR